MSLQSMRGEVRAAFAFVERNYRLARRYLGWELVFIFYAIVNALIMGLIGVERGPQQVLYMVVGALMWSFLSVLFHDVAEAVAWERWEGTIEYTFMAPIHRLTYLGGSCMYAVLYGSLRTVLVLMMTTLFFGLDLSGANLWGAGLVLCVASLSFIGLGLLAATLPLLSPERGPEATHILQGFILLVSGVYYDVSVLPEWLQPVSTVSPATYALRAARGALLDNVPVQGLLGDLGLLVVLGAGLIPLGLLVFTAGERYAMKTGKLKRSG